MGEDRAPDFGGRDIDPDTGTRSGLSEETIRLRAKARRATEAAQSEGEDSRSPEDTSPADPV